MAIRLHALLLADHVYRDEDTAKHVVAGTFHRLHVDGLPAMFSSFVFLVVSGVNGTTGLGVAVVSDSGSVVAEGSGPTLTCDDPEELIEIRVRIPVIALPRAGRYAVRVTFDDEVVGEAPLIVSVVTPVTS